MPRFRPLAGSMHSKCGFWLLFCCRACPRSNLFELNLVRRRACSRSRHAPPCLTDHAPPPSRCMASFSVPIFEVVLLPDESQIVTLGMQASTKNLPILGYPSRELLSPHAIFCHPPVRAGVSWSLASESTQRSRKKKFKPSARVPA